MKKLKLVSFISLLLCSLLFTTGCEQDVEIHGSCDLRGRVSCNPKNAMNGDVITLTLEKYRIGSDIIGVELGNIYKINGKNVVKSIVYYLDDVQIAESNLENEKYKATYTVDGLSEGKHVVSAKYRSNFKHFEINGTITKDTLTISR